MSSATKRRGGREEAKVTVSKKPLLLGVAVVVLALFEVTSVIAWDASVNDAYEGSNCGTLPPPAICAQLSSELWESAILFGMLGVAIVLGAFVSMRAGQGRYD